MVSRSMDGLSRTYASLLTGSYDCVDRIVLNGYFSMGHDPGGFRIWWRQLTGSEDTLDNAHLMRMAGRFSRRLRAWAIASGIPIRDCSPGEQKHEIGEDHLSRTTIKQGLFLILVGRAQAPVWDVGDGRHIRRKKPSPFVNHYSFHILDRDWGHVTIRMSGHPPFPVQIILNGHEYMERQARKAGILFHKEGNCFTGISDIAGFTQIADTLAEESVTGRLIEVCDRWIYTTCLCFALDLDEQKRSGFHYQYSTFQFEYSRNLIFASGQQMSQVMEALVDRNRVRMDMRMLKTILGRKERPHRRKGRKLADWYVTVERPSYDLTIFKLHCGKLALKIYTKGERVLRTEAMAQNAEALKCGRLVDKFAVSVQRLKAILERFLEALSCLDRCFISDGTLDRLPVPSIVGTTRVGGIDINRERMHRVIRALLALSASPGGFTASQLSSHVVAQTALTPYAYRPRQASYDLKKFRGKQMVVRIGNTRRYEVLPDALMALSALVLLQNKIIKPVLASVAQPALMSEPSDSTVLDQRYETLRRDMLAMLREVGFAA
jgi:hypothetical protein